uniref:Transmembrane protein n=1 Tax=Panagrellus redivivus TaxID=6233 RepID=A0A7E4VMP0_PANRE
MNTLVPLNETCIVGCDDGTVCVKPWGWRHPHLCVQPALVGRRLDTVCACPSEWMLILFGFLIAVGIFFLYKGLRRGVGAYLDANPEMERFLGWLPRAKPVISAVIGTVV